MKLSTQRKRVQLREENILFMRKVRRAKERATLRTEQMSIHNLLFNVTGGLRERVLQRHKELEKVV